MVIKGIGPIKFNQNFRTGGLLAFYAGLQDVRRAQRLVYAIIRLVYRGKIIAAVVGTRGAVA